MALKVAKAEVGDARLAHVRVVVDRRAAERRGCCARGEEALERRVRKLHGATLFVERDEVAAPRLNVLKAVDEPVAPEAVVARPHCQRLAQLVERQRAPHNASPAEHFPGKRGLAALADAPEYALVRFDQALQKS